MLDSCFPVEAVIKCAYDSASESIVESKSLKLYLNAYNMAKMGATVTDALEAARNQIAVDLTKTLMTEVDVYLHLATDDSTTELPVNKYDFRLLDEAYLDGQENMYGSGSGLLSCTVPFPSERQP